MVDTSAQPAPHTLTPAVLASALFVVASAIVAITFVAARGGLQMPIAPSGSDVAVASAGTGPVPSAPSSLAPSTLAPSASLGPSATPAATPQPTAPSSAPPSPTPAGSPDPLTALPGCPNIPGCYEYLIKRGDSLSGVASHYAIPVSIVRALNPEITDPGTIVAGEILYLGRDPFLRLPPCDAVPNCSLYTIQPGDRLSTIAGRFGITVPAILAANPQITDSNAIYSGQVIRLPHPAA
ncbi:MAG: LysM peptidoglycan-binding domain-containing protein [Chloroflexi bacterium]|nr:LysM peptidoglycan-binding domain-containing protein [Chloroflexota bacterium]